jgi:hypothetical protein
VTESVPAGAADPPRYFKRFGRFDPVSDRSREECDRHYRDVHVPFAGRMLLGHEGTVSYHTARALGEYDVTNGFAQQPTAWRYIVLRYQAGRNPSVTKQQADLMAQDHLNFLSRLRSCAVRERVLVERRSAQTALEKYIFEYDRAADVGAADALERFRTVIDELMTKTTLARTARLVIANEVLSEQETAPLREPGQLALPRNRAETDKVGYLEFWFDSTAAAEDYFVAEEVGATLRPAGFAVRTGYHVEERCVIDRR